MLKQRGQRRALFSLAPVEFRNSPIEGRGVFARRRFSPGDVIVAYAPKQERLDANDPRAAGAADTKLTLLSEGRWVIVPDTTVPGGWLSNHGCHPNAALYSSGEGRIQCLRPIAMGEEVTIFYGWVTENEPGRDPCRCRARTCRGAINFDVSDEDVRAMDSGGAEGDPVRRRYEDYAVYLRAIDQEQVIAAIEAVIERVRARLR